MRRILIGLACLVALASVASAQTPTAVTNPKTVEFTASADHAAVDVDGSPTVVRYELRMYLESAPDAVIATTDLGKPTPVAGQITVTNPLWFAALTPRTRYVAKVAAIGAGGEGISAPSNPFGRAVAPVAVPPPLIR